MKMYFRIKHIDRLAGIFVILALILILITIVFVARGQKWFSKRQPYLVVFDRVGGIKPGTDVTISGMQVGRVKSLRLNEERKVEITLEIFDDYKDYLRKDSSATVISGLLGGKTVEITPGSPDQALLRPGETIPSQEPRELTDFLKGLDLQAPLKKAEATLGNLEAISAKLKDPQGELFRLLNNIEFISQQLRQGEGNIGAILQDKKIYNELSTTLTSLRRSAEHLEKTTERASRFAADLPKLSNDLENYLKEVPKILGDVERATARLPEVTEKIQKATDEMPVIAGNLKEITKDVRAVTENLKKVAPEIPELVSASQESIEEAEKLLQTLRNHWLIRGWQAKPPQSMPLEVSQRENPY
ncbi:MAG: MlaD family protein [Thermodesulfobacteriota bacterium]